MAYKAFFAHSIFAFNTYSSTIIHAVMAFNN